MVSVPCFHQVFRVLLTSAWESSFPYTDYQNWSCAAKARCLNRSHWLLLAKSSLHRGLSSHYQKLRLIELLIRHLSCNLVACCTHMLSFDQMIPLLDFGRFDFRLVIVSSNYRFAFLRSDQSWIISDRQSHGFYSTHGHLVRLSGRKTVFLLSTDPNYHHRQCLLPIRFESVKICLSRWNSCMGPHYCQGRHAHLSLPSAQKLWLHLQLPCNWILKCWLDC